MSINLRHSPHEFVSFLQQNRISFAFFVSNQKNSLKPSHEILHSLAAELSKEFDYDNHEAIFINVSSEGFLQSAFVHRTCRGAGAGGVRLWFYPTLTEFFADGFRLSKGMTLKNALAGIWWGGGKGVIARNSGSKPLSNDQDATRKLLFRDYGKFMTRLSGCYVTAEDLGVTPADMENIYSCTRFTTCIPEYIGGSGVPSLPTAHGVACGINAALDYLGIPLRNATVAIQGVGHVGGALALLLLKSGVKKIIASDVDSNAIKRAQETMASVSSNFELHLKEKGDNSILFSEVDIVSPCAVGATLNEKTIPYIKARAVCGAANNQLHDPCKDDKRLNEKGIIYIPDFLVNRMGIVNCCDEHVGYLHPHLEDPLIKRHLGKEWPNSIYCLINSILKESSITHKTTQELAVEMAERESRLNNPLYGHRGIQIIRSIQRQLEGSVNEGNAQ